jgi:uncharacterized protein YdeI (YjbR/CyaY-like superfamily)
MELLSSDGRVQPGGLAAFENRKENKSRIYSYENQEVEFPPVLKKQFKANKKAWDYFESLAPSYRKPSINWVMSAKQESTIQKRLAELIKDSEAGTNKWKDNPYTIRKIKKV